MNIFPYDTQYADNIVIYLHAVNERIEKIRLLERLYETRSVNLSFPLRTSIHAVLRSNHYLSLAVCDASSTDSRAHEYITR